MSYSYIQPKTKSVFTKEFQLLITFFSITLFMLFGAYTFLLYSDYRFERQISSMQQQKDDIRQNIATMDAKISTIEQQLLVSERIFTKNSVLKESIHNLFDLVPNSITLSEAKIMQNGLILNGVTPNKDVYNFMLQAPLRSIFHKTYSSFYPAQNGWLNFVSTNYLEEEVFSNEE
ncbi:MAG: hypothetical protein QG559_515 [Campylobacterota bacterium]|nr:hypothetical protein [Campylobacterota bacterium]